MTKATILKVRETALPRIEYLSPFLVLLDIDARWRRVEIRQSIAFAKNQLPMLATIAERWRQSIPDAIATLTKRTQSSGLICKSSTLLLPLFPESFPAGIFFTPNASHV